MKSRRSATPERGTAVAEVGGDRKLRIGVLGCGQIAQAAHFESCAKARNAELFAICDVSSELLARMAAMHQPKKTYSDYDAMLADPEVEAVIIATADAFHVPAALAALAAGKHVLSEKPLGIAVEEVEALRTAVRERRLVLNVGHMKRFDPGIQSARAFIDDEMGDLVALKAWYCDSTHRYSVTDAVQPLIVRSGDTRRPAGDPKGNLRRYYMLAHGSHLLDTARFLAGEIVEVAARFSERGGMRCWFIDVEFASGAIGHLDLTVAVRMDWHEGFQIYGRNGSVLGRTFNPWLYKASEVDIFRESDGAYHRVLGADAHFYRRQLEAFADTVLTGTPHGAADIDDGVASVRAMVAVAQSIDTGRPVKLADAFGAVS
jgi:predicted dehydrogenase